MTNEEQRIAIAEACGLSRDWDYIRETYQQFRNRDDDGEAVFQLAKVPDYLFDLNAMHEAEKVLTLQQLRQMTVEIHDIMTRDPQQDWIPVCHATAAQRAEAFLRTIGKWKE